MSVRSRVLIVAGAVVVVAAAAAMWFVSESRDENSSGDVTSPFRSEEEQMIHAFVVPAGTYERTEGGEEVNIVPRNLDVRVGDAIQIRNDDDFAHSVGPYTVRAHETLQQQFTSPGELSGECTLHPSGSFTITVHP